MKKLKSREEFLNEGHSYDNEIEKARMMQGSASDLVEWASRKIAESRPENFKEGIISPIQEAKESYKIMRLVNGRTKELIEGTIEEIMDQFSKAIDKLRDSGSGKQYKDDPKTIEELVKYLNAAQQYIDKGKSKITYEIQESVDEAAKDHRFKYVISKDYKNHGVVDFVKGDQFYVEIDADGNTVPYSYKDVWILDDEDTDKLQKAIMKGKLKPDSSPKELKAFVDKHIGKKNESVNEARKPITKKHWDKADDDQKEDWLLQVYSDPDDAEKHIGKSWDNLPPQAITNMFEALNFIIRPAKSGDPFEPYGKPFFITTKDADLVVKKMNDLGIRTFTNKDGDEFEVGLETFDPKTFAKVVNMDVDYFYKRKSSKLLGINQEVLQKALDVLDQRKDKITGFGWMSTNESLDEGDMTNKHGGFLITYVPNGMRLKATYKKGVDSKKREEAAFAKILKDNPKVKEKDLKITGYFGKKEYADLVQDIPVRLDEAGEVRLNEADDNWSDDVKTKWTPPAGLFTEPANKIADVLHKESDDLDQAMSRLQFYINRGGKLLDGKAKANLETAKKLLQQKYD